MGKEFGVGENNKYIKDYLLQYCNYETALNYAVLIKGKWGSGKTYFIKDFIEENKKEIKFVYVSLFGLSKLEEVNEKIFEAFHPILSSKHMKFFSSVAQGAIKFGLKVDLENIISLDKAFKQELEKYVDIKIDENSLIKNILSYMKPKKNDEIDNKKRIVFVFDDLERSLIDTKQTLSLINDFIEQKGLKVILLSNEEEIEDEEIYNKFKEKVIGKEFEIKLDLENAYFSFLEKLDNENVKNLLTEKYLLIKDIFIKLEINNLRVLAQTFIEFELFIENFDQKFFDNEEFIETLLLHFFAFVMYYKKTNFLEEILKIESSFFDDKNENKSIFQKKLNISLFGIIFRIEFWKKFLKEGYLNKQQINDYIKNTIFFKNELKQDWVKLWHYWELNEDEFNELLLNVKNQFFNCNNEFENFYILLHIVGIIIFFMQNGILQDVNERKIIEQFQKCVNKFKNSKFWKEKEFDTWDNPTGLGFLSSDTELFNKIKKLLQTELLKIKEKAKKEKKINDIKEFFEYLKIANKEKVFDVIINYKYEPFFDIFDEKQIEKLIDLPAKSLFILNHIISGRYDENHYINSKKRYCLYLSELPFLEKFEKKLRKLENNVNKLKRIAIKYLLINISKAIKKLKECKNETS